MIADSRLQYLLSQTPQFQSRLQILMTQVATEVLAETGVGTTHAARAVYAVSVLRDPMRMAQNAAVYFAQSTNVRTTITMENEGPVSSVTDAALASQIASSWNVIAGIDSGS